MPYVKIIAEADFGTFTTNADEVQRSHDFYQNHSSEDELAIEVARILGWTEQDTSGLDYMTQLVIVSAGGRS